jgi:tRNA uridine 5-carboxymethylaminomethyl modification enzyme
LKESEKYGLLFRETSVSVAEANPILESKDTALITQGDKFKVFLVRKLIWTTSEI